MNIVLKLEEIAKLFACYLISLKLGFSFWVFWIWLLVPDVSIIGYIINTRIGAIIYNIFHHQGLSLMICLAGLFTNSHNLIFTGLVLFGHSSMDRIFGFGLKYIDNFKHTHLGKLDTTK